MSLKTTQDYLNLITSEYQRQPNFVATIKSVTDVLVQIQTLLASMITIFDLNLPPVGNQLDIIGQWVGASRNLSQPISSDAFFTWDGTVLNGWDSGTWSSDQTEIITLPDDAYLTLIKATIAKNTWNGTIDGIYANWDALFPQYSLLIQDFQNMSFLVAIQGTVMDPVTQGLLTGGYLVPKPEGVRITNYVVPVDTNPLFAWDCDNDSLAGWDDGSWGKVMAPT